MTPTLLGRKIGMTQIYLADGSSVPVTVVQAGPCVVVQVKRKATDGYDALQIGAGARKPHGSGKATAATKPATGHAKKAGLAVPPRLLREIPWDGQGEFKAGQELTCKLFEGIQYVDVVGTSKGRGFAGVVKRHGFHGGPTTHGQSDRTRAPGSIGNNTDPARVVLGKKMAGHMGAKRSTVRSLQVVKLDAERSVLLLRGAVPGPNGGWVLVRKAKTA